MYLSKIKIVNYKGIKEFMKEALGLKTIYFNAKLLRTAGANLTDIMSKYFNKYVEA